MPIIIQINVTANWGSTGRIAEQINIKALDKRWNCYIAFGRNCTPSRSKLIKVGSKFDVYEHYIENRLFDNEGLASRIATKKLIKKIQNIAPDIIHLHNLHDHWLNYKLLFDFLNQTNIPIIWTFHDCWAFTGHCSHFVHAKCNKWMEKCEKCQFNASFIDNSYRNYELKKKLFTNNPNIHIVAVSDWLGNLCRKSFFKYNDIRVIENGIDLTIFKPTYIPLDDNIGEDKYVIMAVSSQWNSKSKGLMDYLEMSNLLKDDEVIVLVGVHEELKKRLPSNIIGIGRTNNQEELAALYTRANVVTSFSSAETFGLTIVEGYACGTPAVVYDNSALPSLITIGTGFVVPDKDYKAAYEAIQVIKDNGKNFYLNSCIKVAKKYDKDKCFEKYISLYNEVLNL